MCPQSYLEALAIVGGAFHQIYDPYNTINKAHPSLWMGHFLWFQINQLITVFPENFFNFFSMVRADSQKNLLS